MGPGQAVHVTPPTIHRMTAIEDSDVFEVSTADTDDVVRLEDRYGRQGTLPRDARRFWGLGAWDWRGTVLLAREITGG